MIDANEFSSWVQTKMLCDLSQIRGSGIVQVTPWFISGEFFRQEWLEERHELALVALGVETG